MEDEEKAILKQGLLLLLPVCFLYAINTFLSTLDLRNLVAFFFPPESVVTLIYNLIVIPSST